MLRYQLQPNSYLKTPVGAYSNCSYIKYGQNGATKSEEEISKAIRTLKNQYKNEPIEKLTRAKNYLKVIAKNDISAIITANRLPLAEVMLMCVPRSKATFTETQRFFQKAIYEAANELRLQNGANSIERQINTKTTHLINTSRGDLGEDGDLPYPGITNQTCQLRLRVENKTIILVDDIYTKTVNIDEDCCQYLYDYGAKKVILYTLCKTPELRD